MALPKQARVFYTSYHFFPRLGQTTKCSRVKTCVQIIRANVNLSLWSSMLSGARARAKDGLFY